MTTAWLILTATLAAMALIAIWARRPTAFRLAAVVTLPAAAVIAWYALTVPLGKPAAPPPPGEYTVLGARIDVDVAIYVLLDGTADSNGEPRYHKLPYSNETAQKLQEAMDGGNGVQMDAQEGGEIQFGEPPVAAEEPKQPERPAMQIGDV